MSLYFAFETMAQNGRYFSTAKLRDTHSHFASDAVPAGRGEGTSPGAAVEAAENDARLNLEKLLGLWGEDVKSDEVAR